MPSLYRRVRAALRRRLDRSPLLLQRLRPDSDLSKFSLSELGEDKILWDALSNCPDKTYVDVGCFDPFEISDTWLLYRRGWSGLVVDAQGHLEEAYRRRRPRDRFRAALLTADGRNVQFTNSGGVASADEQWQSIFPGPTSSLASVPVQDFLERELGPAPSIGLLKIDVENLDEELLLAINLTWMRPFCVMVEQHVLWTDQVSFTRAHAHLQAQGYRALAQTRRNVIYVEADRFRGQRGELEAVYRTARGWEQIDAW